MKGVQIGVTCEVTSMEDFIRDFKKYICSYYVWNKILKSINFGYKLDTAERSSREEIMD